MKRDAKARAIRTLIAAAVAVTATVSTKHAKAEAAIVQSWKQEQAKEDTEDRTWDTNIPVNSEESARDNRARHFRHLVRATALDLYGTGLLKTSRARELSEMMVVESYRQNVPLPLLLGILRVENSSFNSRARSMVGARGLMQIMPEVWLPVFGPRLGMDLDDDRINIRFGAAILGENLRESEGDWRSALLRYNGCVRGSNTPNCRTYPDKVRRAIEEDARWVCQGRQFQECIAQREEFAGTENRNEADN